MTALLAKEHQQAINVVPGSWGASTEDLCHLSRDLHLSNVRIAVFGQDQGVEVQFNFLGT